MRPIIPIAWRRRKAAAEGLNKIRDRASLFSRPEAISERGVTLRDLIEDGLISNPWRTRMRNKIRALRWARSVCCPTTIDELLEGAGACEAFLDRTGSGMEEAQDLALDCAGAVLVSGEDPAHLWPEAIADAQRVMDWLVGAISSTGQPVVAAPAPDAGVE